MLPRDILKNPDAGTRSGQNSFLSYDWKEISSNFLNSKIIESQ
jgi:hypothetical protein